MYTLVFSKNKLLVSLIVTSAIVYIVFACRISQSVYVHHVLIIDSQLKEHKKCYFPENTNNSVVLFAKAKKRPSKGCLSYFVLRRLNLSFYVASKVTWLDFLIFQINTCTVLFQLFTRKTCERSAISLLLLIGFKAANNVFVYLT